MSAVPVLGVPLMDTDHVKLHAMFERVATTADADLAALYEAIADEVRAHFAREEVLIDAAGLPIAHCHKTQHNLLLAEFDAAAPAFAAGDPALCRRLLGEVLAGLVSGHVGSVDTVTASFLVGRLGAEAFDNLRLPEG